MKTWLVIALLGAGTLALKGAGPVLLGRRRLPATVEQVAALLPAALLAALVATGTAAAGRHVQVDARVAGVAVAALVLWRKGGFLMTVVLAMATTALVRAVA